MNINIANSFRSKCSKLGRSVLSATLTIPVFSTLLLPTNIAKAQSFTSSGEMRIAQVDRWTTQVRSQLLKASFAAGFGGYQMSHDPMIGSLGHRAYEDITVNMSRGKTYRIIGVCDNDCRDIDLSLYDDNGNLISSDTQRDDTPIVSVTPSWNARFTLRVTMSRCSNNPCKYGIGFFRQ